MRRWHAPVRTPRARVSPPRRRAAAERARRCALCHAARASVRPAVRFVSGPVRCPREFGPPSHAYPCAALFLAASATAGVSAAANATAKRKRPPPVVPPHLGGVVGYGAHGGAHGGAIGLGAADRCAGHHGLRMSELYHMPPHGAVLANGGALGVVDFTAALGPVGAEASAVGGPSDVVVQR